METSRIKNPDFAAQVESSELAWTRHISPITDYFSRQIAHNDYHGKRLAFWGHLSDQSLIIMMKALKESGADIVMGACNVDSTDDDVAAYLSAMGIRVYGWCGMSQVDYKENLAIVRSFEADYLCDMGGELCLAYLDKTPPVKGALEATMTGLHNLSKYELPFPVFDWNSIPLKNLHNRYHVSDEIWPAFNQVTGLGLFGRRVLVIGFGPVGQGIAERARNLGAAVYVTDIDPVRLLEAAHIGCETISLEEGIRRCQIIVTATGTPGVLERNLLEKARPGAILFNAGHSNREIDIEWLNQQPHQRMKAHIERFDLGKTYLFLLAQGSLLNLAGGAGPYGIDLFDLYTAVMLLGIAWMFDGIPDEINPGLQRYPLHLERKIAELSIKLRSGDNDAGI